MNSYRLSIHTYGFCISYYLSVKNRPFLVNALKPQRKDLQLQRCSRNIQNALRRRCRYIRNSLQSRELRYSCSQNARIGRPLGTMKFRKENKTKTPEFLCGVNSLKSERSIILFSWKYVDNSRATRI